MRQQQLGFMLCLPRTGSTMLADCLGLHSKIYCPPEPHLLYPLFHLGYFKQANYEGQPQALAVNALRALVNQLPKGSDDYLDALRAYADTIYGKFLDASGKSLFIDKSPTYSEPSYLPLIERLYPQARYLVLVRNPADTAVSMYRVGNLFEYGEGNAKVWNILRRIQEVFVSLSAFLKKRDDAILVRYEDLVASPARTLERVCKGLGVQYEAGMMNREQYLDQYWLGLGDQDRRPIGKLANTQLSRPFSASSVGYISQLLNALGSIDPNACDIFGYSKEDIQTSVERYRGIMRELRAR